MVIVNSKLAFILVPKNASTSIRAFYGIPSHEHIKRKNFEKYIDLYRQLFTFDKGKLLTTDEYSEEKRCEHVDITTALNLSIIDDDARIIAVIRDPIERLLSLYLYRHKQKRYDTELSIEDFRNKVSEGMLSDRYTWQMKPQSWFVNHSTRKVECWRFEDVNKRFLEFGTLEKHNNSFENNKYSTAKLIDVFYDNFTLQAAKKHMSADIELYNSIS